MNSFFLIIQNVSFTDLNKVEGKEKILNLGGSIRTMNILQRKIINLIVDNVFSDKTNVGLKIIDYDSNIKTLQSKSNGMYTFKVILSFNLTYYFWRLKSQVLHLQTILFIAMDMKEKRLFLFI